MASTPAFALYILGALATLGTIGLFMDFNDDVTHIVVGFAASIVWGLFGMSSFDVIVADSGGVITTNAILPLAYLGIALSLVIGLYVIWEFLAVLGSETPGGTIEGSLND